LSDLAPHEQTDIVLTIRQMKAVNIQLRLVSVSQSLDVMAALRPSQAARLPSERPLAASDDHFTDSRRTPYCACLDAEGALAEATTYTKLIQIGESLALQNY
jgi:hypothetical protein